MVHGTDSQSEFPQGLPAEAIAGRNGAIYALDAQDVEAMLNAIEQAPVKFRTVTGPVNKAKEIITVVAQLCEDDPYGITDQQQVTEKLGLTRSGFLRRLRNMPAFFIHLKTEPIVSDNVRRTFSRFWLDTEAAEKAISKDSTEQLVALEDKVARAQPSYSYQVNKTFADHAQELARSANPKGERFSIFYLFAAFPSGTKGRMLHSILDLKIAVGKDYFDLRVTPLKDGRIAGIRDLQVLAAVITIIHKRLQAHPELDNNFVFDVREILGELGLSNLRENKDRIRDSLYRIRRTSLYVHNATSGIRNHLHDIFTIESDFSLISKVTCLLKDEVIEENDWVQVPDHIRVILDHDMYERIKHQDGALLTTMHKDSLRETNPFDYKFYLWVRRVFRAYIAKADSPMLSLSHLHREIEPYRPLTRFKSDLKKMITKRKNAGEPGLAKLCGYYIEAVDDTYEAFVIWPDERDPLVGKHSYAALKKEQRELPD